MNEKNSYKFDKAITSYLNKIAERLWSGHAALMIGAGFSRNAKPINPTVKKFPDWNELGDKFLMELPGRSIENPKYLNIPKLANEYEAAFGPPALNQLLRSIIPDEDYEPSDLCKRLLDLPWADVFTTNYDTLLERACSSLISQRYSTVVDKEDLIYAERPRIVKLHGSFPSDRPFIITEDDYRKYPKEFAPFVNTVLQALVENTLCLIGFSGDDPNFLQWIGWISDNLGADKSHMMYMIGIPNLSDAQVKLLEQRNITIINLDLSHEFMGDHAKALVAFCEYLSEMKKENDRLNWPSGNDDTQLDHFQKNKEEQLSNLIPLWKRSRLSYPDWIITPEDRRRVLWFYTEPKIDFLSLKDKISAPLDLEFVYELNWRLEKSLFPLTRNLAKLVEKILGRYWPFPDQEASVEAQIFYGQSEKEKFDWIELRKKWLELCLSILRFNRLAGFHKEWEETNDRLSSLIDYLSQEQKARFYYERCLSALFDFNLTELKECLSSWPVEDSLPFWEAKRAGILAEIGRGEEAEKILEKSLSNIRTISNLKPISTNYSFVSKEAYVMLLLSYVQDANLLFKGIWKKGENEKEARRKFTDRWNDLKQFKCDPWSELSSLEKVLERPAVERKEVTTIETFDIGLVKRTFHMDGADKEALIAFNFLCFFEEAGIPFRTPGLHLGKKSALGTLTRITKYYSHWAAVTMVRIGDEKFVDEIFNRESLNEISMEQADELITEYLKALDTNKKDIEIGNGFRGDNFGIVLAAVIPEILSRLCSKCSFSSHEKLLEFLLSVYRSDKRSNYYGTENLMSRLLQSLPDQQKLSLIPKLLEFPVLGDLPEPHRNRFPNPFNHFQIRKINRTGIKKPKIKTKKINELFDAAHSITTEERKRSTCTLIILYYCGFLNKKQCTRLGEALWARVDNSGFPGSTGLYKFAFLELPSPKGVDPVKLMKRYLFKKPFPIQKTKGKSSYSITGGNIPILHELIGASEILKWSQNEVSKTLEHIVEWWDADKEYLKKEDEGPAPFGSGREEFIKRFENLTKILVKVIAPNMSQRSNKNQIETIERLLYEMKDHGMNSLQAEAAFIHVLSRRKKTVCSNLTINLASTDELIVKDAINSFEAIEARMKKREFDELLQYLGQKIFWRKKSILHEAINMTIRMIRKKHWRLNGEFEELVLKGLKLIADDTDLSTGVTEYTIMEKLAIRRNTAYLAKMIYQHYDSVNISVPEEIRIWEQICQSENEFAEIRNQWTRFYY